MVTSSSYEGWLEEYHEEKGHHEIKDKNKVLDFQFLPLDYAYRVDHIKTFRLQSVERAQVSQ